MNIIKNDELLKILQDIYQFSTGLNKTIFKWNLLPKNVLCLAGRDWSGILQYKRVKYYVFYAYESKLIIIERE